LLSSVSCKVQCYVLFHGWYIVIFCLVEGTLLSSVSCKVQCYVLFHGRYIVIFCLAEGTLLSSVMWKVHFYLLFRGRYIVILFDFWKLNIPFYYSLLFFVVLFNF
jgi:hypothetical protein